VFRVVDEAVAVLLKHTIALTSPLVGVQENTPLIGLGPGWVANVAPEGSGVDDRVRTALGNVEVAVSVNDAVWPGRTVTEGGVAGEITGAHPGHAGSGTTQKIRSSGTAFFSSLVFGSIDVILNCAV
jgi:hypothetical protein